MKLIALKPMRYASRALVAGDEFEASERDGRLLKRIKKAGDAPVRRAARAQPEPEAAPAPGPAPEPASAVLGRGVPRYGRRDMRAEEQ